MKVKVNTGSAATMIVVLGIIIAGIGGWVANIVKLAGSDFDPITGIVVIRVIGVVVAPLGAVMGFI